ncbi:OmpA family protein [Pectobacterium odoriferum]|uniref:Porin n=1 Tax=Pectobacterium odoriferum TaxID=78398 RepID=A0ABD6VW37_9GAMM|nr:MULTISPECIES: OmpA family protein [Pectobacterium]AIU87122.1 porin [Pectobacterium odoriferum]KGA36875.1 porin [Pectobacterium odoriferum]KGA41062.1 porin [Pectobacterium odoriferum]MBA0189718.1 OmpA family protein [Pectobacterium odoriferum]POD97042.1 porin [Pectobacterium odoriferum]
MKHYQVRRISLLTAIVTLTTSCATLHDAGRSYGTAIGCIGGAALGGGITYLVTGDAKKAVAGGLLGGAAGCALGNVWQNREEALAKIAKEENIAMTTRSLQSQEKSGTATVGLVAQVQDSGMFDTNSAQLSTDGLRQVKKIATAMKEGDQSGVILVVGHTDATGSAEWNQRLSEQRAQNVGRVLEQAGLSAQKLYFQGAGSARPVADNTTVTGRTANRRVEIVGLANEILLKQRLEQEGSNLAYLRYGTAEQATSTASASSTSSRKPKPATSSSNRKAEPTRKVETQTAAVTPSVPPSPSGAPAMKKTAEPANSQRFVDFGGQPVNSSTPVLAASLKPRSSGFSLIPEANASSMLKSCVADHARVSGQAKNLASGKAVETHETREYLPGMNGRAWAGLVNNHLVTLSPVKVLSDNATVVENPKVYVTRDYQSKGNRKADAPLNAMANAWEGEDSILYRVYLQDETQQALSCVDLLVPKKASKAQQGQLFYSNHNKEYIASYTPTRS